jgi:hypothetical protein
VNFLDWLAGAHGPRRDDGEDDGVVDLKTFDDEDLGLLNEDDAEDLGVSFDQVVSVAPCSFEWHSRVGARTVDVLFCIAQHPSCLHGCDAVIYR